MGENVIIALVVLAAIIVVLAFWVFSLRRVVPTNEVHIIQRGKETISYGKGSKENRGNVYYEFPACIPYIGVTRTTLPISVFDVTLVAYEAYDKGRLPFVVDVKAFFRISDSTTAAARISDFSELKNQITDIVRGAVRSIMANAELEDIMGERAIYGSRFTEMVKEQLGNWGVEPVKNIELMDVRDAKDSEVIGNIMAKKSSEIEMQSRSEVAANMKKAREAEIQAAQDVDLKQEEANQQVGMKKATVQREVGLADERAKQAVKEQAKVTAEKEMEVQKVTQVKKAEIDKEANIILAEQNKEVAVKNAEAVKAQVELRAEADKRQIELKAEAELSKGLKEAQAIEAKGKAEAEAKKQMELAPVNAQITLAKEIGENQGYQDYLVRLEQIKALCEVGIEQAKNLGNADIKINTMANTIPSGVSKVADVFSPQGGLNLAGMFETMAQSPIGQQVIEKVVGKKEKKTKE
ncbi:MAG: SPFH domain-containing protein [Alphaproteobacteria bacterium]